MGCGKEPFHTNEVVFDTEGKIKISTNLDGDMIFTDNSPEVGNSFIKLSQLAGLVDIVDSDIKDCNDVLECITNSPQTITDIIDCNYIKECIEDKSVLILVEVSDWDSVVVNGQPMFEVNIPHGLVIDTSPANLSVSIYDSNYDIITFDKVNVGSTSGGNDVIYVRSTADIEFYILVRSI